MRFGAEVYLKLKSAIDELIERSDEGAIIIVEGVKDVEALRRLGVKGKIVTSANYSNAEVVDLIGRREVIIMTDWDKKGSALERDLVIKFSSWGVVPNTELRKRIFSIIGREVTSVEDLADFMLKLERELGIHWRF
jgi:5S rRNA maturation endonuclease (ribonuclease M5)